MHVWVDRAGLICDSFWVRRSLCLAGLQFAGAATDGTWDGSKSMVNPGIVQR